jgi:hypothetical protein
MMHHLDAFAIAKQRQADFEEEARDRRLFKAKSEIKDKQRNEKLSAVKHRPATA